jgi:hypothetical protein
MINFNNPFRLHVMTESGETYVDFATKWDATAWLARAENNAGHALTAWIENTITGELIFDI